MEILNLCNIVCACHGNAIMSIKYYFNNNVVNDEILFHIRKLNQLETLLAMLNFVWFKLVLRL